MTVFIVGKYEPDKQPWEFQGVFDTEQAAIAACLDERFFVGPIELNAAVQDARIEWPGAYYPKAGN
jgi:hypothetical protein